MAKKQPKCPKCKISMFNAKMEYNFARISGMGVICKNCGCEISNEWSENPEERVQKALQQQEKNIADAERIAKENKNKVKKSEEEQVYIIDSILYIWVTHDYNSMELYHDDQSTNPECRNGVI